LPSFTIFFICSLVYDIVVDPIINDTVVRGTVVSYSPAARATSKVGGFTSYHTVPAVLAVRLDGNGSVYTLKESYFGPCVVGAKIKVHVRLNRLTHKLISVTTAFCSDPAMEVE
jgi:hypothetical protein